MKGETEETLLKRAEREIRTLTECYPEHLRSELEQMETLHLDEEWEGLALQCHDMKGQAPGFGWAEMGRLAELLENALERTEGAQRVALSRLHLDSMACLLRNRASMTQKDCTQLFGALEALTTNLAARTMR